MKRILTSIIIIFLFINVSAQVNYENTYILNLANDGEEFFLTNLGNNNYKYVIYNYDSAKFSLYNIDHSPYLLNIPIPVMSDSLTNTYYRLGYITTSLFDCDSTTIEFAMMLDTPRPTKHPNFAVYRTDGTLIFSKDSVGTIFCIGCGSGSYEMHPIMNTSYGAKLFLFNIVANIEQIFVYSLCGEFPEMITEATQNNNFIKIFPNPTNSQITFDIAPPSNNEEYDLNIFNSSFQSVKQYKISGGSTISILSEELGSSVNYFYSLQKGSKIYQMGKFIILK